MSRTRRYSATTPAVTCRACARPAPAGVVADLGRSAKTMQLRLTFCVISLAALCSCTPADEGPNKKSMQQMFPISAEDFPLSERIVLTGGIAHFETSPLSGGSKVDVETLSALPRTRCWGGACDCPVYAFILTPERKIDGPLLAADVLKVLRAANFKSDHIKDLNTASIVYPGYHPMTANDEIHTSNDEQAVFCKESDLERKEGEVDKEFLPSDSLRWHNALRACVRDGHLYYVLLHAKPHKHGDHSFSEWVVLFAVGVSNRTGNLIGAVTYQACHNFCD